MNLNLLKNLCETPGVPGREERVRDLIEKSIPGLFDKVETDARGSLICTSYSTKKNKQGTKTALVCAHMDEIGFYVRYIDKNGFLWVSPAGGFDTRNLFSRRVLVCTPSGDFEGVMNPGGKPIHISSPEDRKKVPEVSEFFIDLGLDIKDVNKRISIGDFVVMNEPFLEQKKKIVSKAIDNRMACFVAIEAMKKIKSSKSAHGVNIVVAFTVQEEVGLRGAQVAANQTSADYGIGLDVTLSCDTPGVPDSESVTRHGEGVGIMLQDSSMIADYKLVEEACSVARSKKINYQRCILPRGGQDGAAIQKSGSGAKVLALVCGTRYIHTVTESIDKKDLKSTIDLLSSFLLSLK